MAKIWKSNNYPHFNAMQENERICPYWILFRLLVQRWTVCYDMWIVKYTQTLAKVKFFHAHNLLYNNLYKLKMYLVFNISIQTKPTNNELFFPTICKYCFLLYKDIFSHHKNIEIIIIIMSTINIYFLFSKIDEHIHIIFWFDSLTKWDVPLIIAQVFVQPLFVITIF